MATHDLDDLLDELDSALAVLDRRHNRQLWTAVRGGAGLSVSDHEAQAQLERLLGDEDVAMRLDAAFRREGADRVRRRRSALWLTQAVSAQAARQAKVGPAKRQAAALLESFSGTLGRERLSLDGLRTTLVRDSSRARREQAYLALASLGRSMAPLYRDTLAAHSAAWNPRGGGLHGPGTTTPPGLWRQPLSPFFLEWQDTDVGAVADRVLAGTTPLLERFLHLATRAAGVRTLRAWDIPYATARLAEPYERFFPSANTPSAIANGLRACGLPIDSLPLDRELSPRWFALESSGWPERRWAIYPMQRSTGQGLAEPQGRRLPRPEVGIAVDTRYGFQVAALDLAYAVGAAVGVLHCRGGFLAEYRYGRRIDVAGAAIGFLVSESNWLAGQTTLPRSEVGSFLALGCHGAGVLRAMRLREAAARAKAVWVATQKGGGGGPDVLDEGGRLLGEAFGVQFDSDLPALDMATLADPTARPAELLREVAAGQLAGYLRREHGKLMGDRRTGECLIECFWRHGALAPQPAALKLATGAGLDPGLEIGELIRTAGA